ncbi:MAG: hypothetical protein HYX84_04000 [Chloroflexi bacterium]|nr:hypothetical protein [Chloroflexota bacterium]
MGDRTKENRLTEEAITRLEDEIDASEGMASLSDTEGTVALEEYLESPRCKPDQTV